MKQNSLSNEKFQFESLQLVKNRGTIITRYFAYIKYQSKTWLNINDLADWRFLCIYERIWKYRKIFVTFNG